MNKEQLEWWEGQLDILQTKLGYFFKDIKYLKEALTHSSFTNESGLPYSNERLEFLGDAVLELHISDNLFRNFPEMDEGDLTRMRSQMVCNQSLLPWAGYLGIPGILRLGRGLAKKRDSEVLSSFESIFADASEAVFGAVFHEGGFSSSERVAEAYIEFCINRSNGPMARISDPKSLLQIKAQKLGLGHPVYNIISTRGSSHEPLFRVQVFIGNITLSSGEGTSRKEAEFQAARNGLETFTDYFPVE